MGDNDNEIEDHTLCSGAAYMSISKQHGDVSGINVPFLSLFSHDHL